MDQKNTAADKKKSSALTVGRFWRIMLLRWIPVFVLGETLFWYLRGLESMHAVYFSLYGGAVFEIAMFCIFAHHFNRRMRDLGISGIWFLAPVFMGMGFMVLWVKVAFAIFLGTLFAAIIMSFKKGEGAKGSGGESDA